MSPVTEARTTTLIRKPAGRRASDQGRSRLGDYTRPIAKEQRITRDRRPALVFVLLALIVAVAIGAALFGLPVRTWFEQNDQISRLDNELDELESVNADLQSEVDRLQTPAGISEAAREELGLIEYGEQRQTVAGLPLLPTDLPDGWPFLATEQILTVRASAPTD
jgi:cell division protein FtsL